jgi:predicted nucleic acid-binding protein
MAYLLDTGVLLRAFDPKSPLQHEILQAIDWLWTQKEPLFVTVQNLAEFWNVATRPIDVNGMDLSVLQVAEQIGAVEDIALVLNESDASFRIWKKLVAEYRVVGAKVHDARLVSVMLAEGISSVLTLNERDFRRYPGITPSNPSSFGHRP